MLFIFIYACSNRLRVVNSFGVTAAPGVIEILSFQVKSGGLKFE